MNPAFAFLAGALFIWIVANGKAGAVWKAITGAQMPTNPTTQRPPDPGNNGGGGVIGNPNSAVG